MRWVVIFEDLPHMLLVRKEHEPEHFAYLTAHQNEILLAGGLREGDGFPFCGGLWVMAPMTKERAIGLVESDPYFINGKRSYKLLQWGKAFQDIAVTL